MGLFSRKNKKVEQTKSKGKEQDIELTVEDLDKVTAAIPLGRAWCPRVDVEPINVEELSEKSDSVRDEVAEIDEK